MSVIQVRRAFKKYNSRSDAKIVLNDFNMDVYSGSIYALMGSSGCGKTTLISCIMGVKNFDKGWSTIFGEPSIRNRSRFGFMPQETAMVNEFSIREMIWFYGTIYGMSSRKINERIEFLSNLLELPPGERNVGSCSGGQQRRISFALTLVHEPEILILDEPTVGVDPLLRAKIWDYLVDITRHKGVTVLLSTHYIEEARQSTHIGLMRNGVQVAEDSPNNILAALDVASLEDAFLKLSQKQEIALNQHNYDDEEEDQIPNGYIANRKDSYISYRDLEKVVPEKVRRPIQTNKKILKALMMRNLYQVSRNILTMAIIIFVPAICIFGMHNSIGGKIKDLTIGIVNEETNYVDDCGNSSMTVPQLNGSVCRFSKVSCRYIDEFDDEVAKKIYYKTYEDAYEDTKRGKIFGFINFAGNYSETYEDFINGELEFAEEAIIAVHLDQSDTQKTLFVQKEILDAYQRYSTKLLQDCGWSERAGKMIPFTFQAAYGKFSFDFRTTFVPGLVVSGCFLLCAYVLSISIISDRLDGNWNRILVAGANPSHFVLSHLVEGVALMLIVLCEYATYATLILSPDLSIQSIGLIIFLLLLVSFNGLVFGLFFSIIMDSVKASMLITMFSAYPATFISGIVWPLEGMPIYMQYISQCMPFTLPISAYRNIIAKGATLLDPKVYPAFIMLFIWISTQLLLCFVFINRKGVVKKN